MYANYSKSKWGGEKKLKVIAAVAAGYCRLFGRL